MEHHRTSRIRFDDRLLGRRCALLCGLTITILLSAGCHPDSERTSSVTTVDTGQTASTLNSVASTSQSTGHVTFDRDHELRRCDQSLQNDDVAGAVASLHRILVVDPEDTETVFRLAKIEASRNRFAQAVELLDSIPPEHPQAGIPAFGYAADWCMVL